MNYVYSRESYINILIFLSVEKLRSRPSEKIHLFYTTSSELDLYNRSQRRYVHEAYLRYKL